MYPRVLVSSIIKIWYCYFDDISRDWNHMHPSRPLPSKFDLRNSPLANPNFLVGRMDWVLIGYGYGMDWVLVIWYVLCTVLLNDRIQFITSWFSWHIYRSLTDSNNKQERQGRNEDETHDFSLLKSGVTRLPKMIRWDMIVRRQNNPFYTRTFSQIAQINTESTRDDKSSQYPDDIHSTTGDEFRVKKTFNSLVLFTQCWNGT